MNKFSYTRRHTKFAPTNTHTYIHAFMLHFMSLRVIRTNCFPLSCLPEVINLLGLRDVMQAKIIYTVLEQVWSSHETEYGIVKTELPLLAVLCTAAPSSRNQLTLRSARVISDWLSDFLLILIFLPRRQLLHPWRWSVVSVPCRLSWIAFTVSSWQDFSYETGAVSVALRRFVENF